MSSPYDPSQPTGDPSNPYGPPPPVPPQNPYGAGGGAQPPYGAGGGAQPPYGAQPYPGAPFGGPPPAQTDVVSIVAFVLSLTCCLSVVGLVMGFVGLSRTKGGRRKGRWAAIAAIPIGAILTLVTVGVVVVIGVFAGSVVSVDDARAGVCIDVDDSDTTGVIMTESDCDESHDAEIVYAGQAGGDAGQLESDGATLVCLDRVPDLVSAAVQDGTYLLSALLLDPTDVSPDDTLICYVEPAGGQELTAPIPEG